MTQNKTPIWTIIIPILAWAALGASWAVEKGAFLMAVQVCALITAVFASVYHAEVVAHRIGEPYGTLVFALAVTIIEVALILSVMINSDGTKSQLARDTVYATVMIVCNGIVGLCLMAGGVRHHVQDFHLQGASSALAILAVLTVMTFMIPNITSSMPGPEFNSPQLIFVGAVSLILYGALIFFQTVSHRDYFLPRGKGEESGHAAAPSNSVTLVSLVLLIIALIAIIGIAKMLSPSLEKFFIAHSLPKVFTGIFIAGLVLMPEGLAAYRAARANRLQTSLNLALGSALASIGLTIPAVAAVSVFMGYKLELGLDIKETTLLMLTLFLGAITLGTGKTTFLQGVVHFVLFLAYLFFIIVP